MSVLTRAKRADPGEFHEAPVPPTRDLAKVRRAAAHCEACHLYRNATQSVFGEGPRHAEVVFVGEQPGDSEDREGKPFVGPAGRLLDRALVDAGIDRTKVYVTNAVKHFKWEPRGKRRLHKKPSPREVAACRPWLEAELEILQPRVVVALGSTAVLTLLGSEARVMRDRGQVKTSPLGPQTLVTVHPSSLLRAPDEETRHQNYALFVKDLKRVAELLRRG